MKQIIRGILAFGLLAATCSCTEFLSTESPSTMPDTKVFSTEGDTYRAVMNIYAILARNSLYSQRVSLFAPYNNDIEYAKTNATSEDTRRGMWDYTLTSANSETLSMWADLYMGINSANECIAGMENGPLLGAASPDTPSTIRQLYGEAKALRALLYLVLVRDWGDVPFLTKETRYDDNFYVAPTDRDEILSFLIEDLAAAEPGMLYASELTEACERMNRGAVQALITADVNAGGGLFYGATHTQIALSGGYISIVRTQTSTFGESLGSTTNTPLEEPVTTCRTMTAAHFLGDLAGQLFYALNVNEQTIESLMGMMGGMGIAEGEEAAAADIGDYLTGFSGDEGGYSLSLDLGKLLGMDASAGMTGSAVIAIERGDGVLSSLNANATLLGLVNANVSAVNNAPGTPVELSALSDLCGQAALLLGYDSYADLLADVAAGGCVSSAQ